MEEKPMNPGDKPAKKGISDKEYLVMGIVMVLLTVIIFAVVMLGGAT